MIVSRQMGVGGGPDFPVEGEPEQPVGWPRMERRFKLAIRLATPYQIISQYFVFIPAMSVPSGVHPDTVP